MTQRLPRLSVLLAALIVIFLGSSALAQVQTPRYVSMAPNTNGYYEYLPAGYNSGSASYPLIVFIHGMGELGNGSEWELPKVLNNGVPNVIRAGAFPPSFNVFGQSHSFIVISPQFTNWPSPDDINNVINYATSHYRVNLNRIYVTGVSMGGGATWEYAGNNATYANRVAAIVPVCGASWPEPGRARVIANANLPVWATHFEGDGTVPAFYTHDYITNINQAPAPTPLAKKSVWPGGGHDAWTRTYDPQYREGGMNIYEWMLQYYRGPAMNTGNGIPVANAGNDHALTLPQNSVQLNGTGTDPDGTISSYNWTKIAGPTQFNLSNAYSANPVLSNLLSGTYTFRLTISDNRGAIAYDDVSIVVTPVVPGKIEAESWSNMYGVRLEGSADAGGGNSVGYIDNGDWMDYVVNVPNGGTYTANFRLATALSGAQFQVRNGSGGVLATVNVPNTGDWQSWQTTSTTVVLPAGVQTIRIFSSSAANWNINWMEFVSGGAAPVNAPPTVNAGSDQSITLPQNTLTLTGSAADTDGSIISYNWTKVSGPSAGNIASSSQNTTQVSGLVQGTYVFRLQVTDNRGASATDELTVTVGAAPVTPPAPVGPVSGSLRIEAEHYTVMQGVQTESTTDAGGGLNVGYIDNTDFMTYSINAPAAGTYILKLRVATPNAAARFDVRAATGSVLATVNVPNTGWYQNWQTAEVSLTLPQGQQTITLVSTASDPWNINWLELLQQNTTTPPTPPTPTPTPSSGNFVALPAKIQAENWSAMSGVQTESTIDVDGGLNVGYIDQGDWMEYRVNAPVSGTYMLRFRVASPNGGGELQLSKSEDGTIFFRKAIPNTGSYQYWDHVDVNVTLQQGQQTLRVTSSKNANWNFNWVEFFAPAGVIAPPPPPPAGGGSTTSGSTTRIEAENWSAMQGVQTESTQDAGGGLNVGYVDRNDWMDYSYNAPVSGTYTISIRVASGGRFDIEAGGNKVGSIRWENTGGFQTWQTFSTTINLSAGQQTIRLISDGGTPNINWIELRAPGATTTARMAAGTEELATAAAGEKPLTEAAGAKAAIRVFPNPIEERFTLQLNSDYTGAVRVVIRDGKGSAVKSFTLTKGAKGVFQAYLSLQGLTPGTYNLSTYQNNEQAQSLQIIKK